MFIKRLIGRWMLMNEAGAEGGAAGGAAPAAASAAAPTAPAAGTPPAEATASGEGGVKPPESLLGDGKEAPAAGENGAAEADKEASAGEEKPIAYTDFTLPEGLKLDGEKLDAFKALAAEAKMPQEAAQKMLDLYANEFKQISEAPMRAWSNLQETWRNEVINDPVIGGAKLDKNLATIKTGLKNLLGEESGKFFEALNVTGAGNNPEIVRGLLKAAAPHAPASPVAGAPGKSGKTAGAVLYPTMAGLGNGHQG